MWISPLPSVLIECILQSRINALVRKNCHRDMPKESDELEVLSCCVILYLHISINILTVLCTYRDTPS